MKKALVTGGGFIGSAIVRRLAALGVETVVVDRRVPDRALLELPIQFLQGDIRDGSFLTEACRGCDVVFHTAAEKAVLASREEARATNVRGTQSVIDACLASRVRVLVHASTAQVVFTGEDLCGVNEQTPYAARLPNSSLTTRKIAEKLVLQANSAQLRTTALRPGLLWGPGDPEFIPWLVKTAASGRLRIVGHGRNLVDICYVENAAAAHLAAAVSLESGGRAAGEAYFITQGEPVIFWNWINRILRRLELPPVEEAISFRRAYWRGRVLEWSHLICGWPREPQMTSFQAQCLARSQWFSIAKAERDLGYRPEISTGQGVDRTVAWIRES